MNTKNPARFYETLHIYERVEAKEKKKKKTTTTVAATMAIGEKEKFALLETFMIHTTRDHRFELIRRQSSADEQIKVIHRINLISLYGRFILC